MIGREIKGRKMLRSSHRFGGDEIRYKCSRKGRAICGEKERDGERNRDTECGYEIWYGLVKIERERV